MKGVGHTSVKLPLNFDSLPRLIIARHLSTYVWFVGIDKTVGDSPRTLDPFRAIVLFRRRLYILNFHLALNYVMLRSGGCLYTCRFDQHCVVSVAHGKHLAATSIQVQSTQRVCNLYLLV